MKRLAKVWRFWETVRHLKTEQILYRGVYKLSRPRIDDRPAPPLRHLSSAWVPPARRSVSMTGPIDFVFLNEPGNVAEIGWDGDSREKLWRYNQHYFDDLNAIGANMRQAWHAALIERWIAENAPASGTAWESYPTSLRIVNWVKWVLAGNELPASVRQSLAVQTRWLSRRLERHLLGNHLFANAKALIFAGTLLGGAEGDAWQSTGTRILLRELPRQILSDGGHFELSPMYHALALEDVLDLIDILRVGGQQSSLLAACEQRVPTMQAWLASMSHPDGDIAFFNDAAIGIAPSSSELMNFAARLGFAPPEARTSVWLEESGYARIGLGNVVLLADLAQVGPSYLPGHAHADTLSFELSLGEERILVNGGTSMYGLGEERLRQRGTSAHNCVVVEGRNSSDVWSGFRVGQRARPLSPQMSAHRSGATVHGGHDGYRSLPGSPRHWRTWTVGLHSILIEDELTNPALSAQALFHFHPDLEVEATGIDSGIIVTKSGRHLRWRASHDGGRVIPGIWHREFGLSHATSVLALPLRGGRSSLELRWN